MNKILVATAQIVIGVIVGNAASNGLNKGVDAVKKTIVNHKLKKEA